MGKIWNKSIRLTYDYVDSGPDSDAGIATAFDILFEETWRAWKEAKPKVNENEHEGYEAKRLYSHSARDTA